MEELVNIAQVQAPLDGDVGWPWWVGLLVVCAVLLIAAYAGTRRRP